MGDEDHDSMVRGVLLLTTFALVMVSESAAVRDSKEVHPTIAERVWPGARNFIAGMASGVGLVLAGQSANARFPFAS